MDRFVSITNKFKLFSLLFLLIGGLLIQFNTVAFAQSYSYQIVLRASATGTRSANITATGSAFHQLTWNVLGTVSACSVQVDSSSDGVTWNSGDIIAAQTCTSNGQAISTSHVINFVRINVTSFTGTGQVSAILDGYINSPVSGGGNVTGSGLTSGHIITGAGGSAIQDSGSVFSQIVITNPSAGQTITSNGTDGFHIEQFPCASLNANTQNNAGCAAAFNTYVVNSISTTQNNLRKGLNIYYQGNAQQGNSMFGLQVNTSEIQDVNTNATNNNISGVTSDATVTGSFQLVNTLYGFDSRPRLFGSGTHATRLVYFHGETNNLPAGTTVDLLQGIAIGASSSLATITSGSGIYLDANSFPYGFTIDGSTRAGILSDTTAAKSGLCHGTYSAAAPMVVVEHDCWISGSGSPEGVVTANIGSFFSRQNGGANTSLYVKESGTGNTGWVPVLTTSSWAAPGTIGSTTPNTGAFTTISATGQITSTLATGTSPFSITSTTVVPLLNVSQLLGNTWAVPASIGATTPNAGAFTTLSATGTLTLGTNGGTQGTLTLNGSVSGSASWQAGTTAATLTTAAAINTASITSSNSVTAGSGNNFTFNGRSKLASTADGLLTLLNNGGTDFTRLMFGGTTSSFPAIKKNGTALNFRLADDSADAPVTSGGITIGGGTQLLKVLSTTATLDFGNLVSIGCEDLTVTLTGAALGDTVALGVPNGSVPSATFTYSAWVSATNTVTIRGCALVSGDPASGTFRATIAQF